jgi:Taurine catabolism dioxygenase TauD, TfdA family
MIEVHVPEPDRPYAIVQTIRTAQLSEIDPDQIISLYKANGAILLRGFSGDLSAFKGFAAQFCVSSVFNESSGRQLLDSTNNIQSVNGGVAAFPLHPELSREPWKPDVCFFYCLTPPSLGGETTLCDGIEIVRALPDDIRAGFASRRLLYVQGAWPEALKFWLNSESPSDAELANPPAHCPYQFVRISKDVIARTFSRPALHQPVFSDAPAFGNFLLFARYMRGNTGFPVFENGDLVPQDWVATVKSVSDRLTAAISWQAGDLLMIDNTRFMHGRNAILDPGERLIASYFGYLNFAPPDPEEPDQPLWRLGMFRPPVPEAHPINTRR